MVHRPSSDSATVASEIIARKNELLRQQRDLLAERSEITSRLRMIERDLSDCRATARFFSLDIDFPDPEEERAAAARREHEARMARATAVHHPRLMRDYVAVGPSTLPMVSAPVQEPEAVAPETPAPPLREFLLNQLQKIGAAGAKAAGLRALYEQSYGKVIHEKTVGMTLYRMAQSGETHRLGHVWYFGKLPAEALFDNTGD